MKSTIINEEFNMNEINEELEQEIKHIVAVPTMDLSMRQQQVELSMSCQHIIHLCVKICKHSDYLLERLKYSETERFS